jgi:molybdopterin molybdotransferase
MITVDEAMDRVRTSVPRLESELVPTTATLGRVLAEAVTTLHPLPLFHQSAVDGFAVQHPDIARPPVTLPIASVVAAGPRGRTPDLAAGAAARIFTGALLPEGADTVVRQELTSADEKSVTIHDTVTRGADVRWQGEELPAGSPLCAPGTRVNSGLIGALILSGACHVKVVRQPRVRVLVTGDEITPSGLPLRLGQVPDSNGPLISAALTQWGVDSIVVDYVPDRPDDVARALRAAFDDADLVISSGGVSVGDFDFIPSIAESIGCERILWNVAQRPGGPLYVARRNGIHLFGLPGNPAAVLVNMHVYVRLALDALATSSPALRWQRGKGPEPFRGVREKTLWLRCLAGTDEWGVMGLAPLPHQASHMLSNLAVSNALARVPPTGPDHGSLERIVLSWLPLDS